MPSTNPLRIPVALHSNRSAMTLLHTIPLALVITRRDRPGKWIYVRCEFVVMTKAEYGLWGVSYGCQFRIVLFLRFSMRINIQLATTYFGFSIMVWGTQKIRVSAAVKTTPVPLHSSQSAMALLHEIGPTCLIIETDHPGT